MARNKERRETFQLETMLTYRVSVLYSLLARSWRHIGDDYDLPLREWRVLAILATKEPMSASELVARSPLDKASVSRAVANLERRGLVSSEPDTADARVWNLALTAAGRRIHREVAPLSAHRQHEVVSVLSKAEQEALFRSLDKLIGRVNDLLNHDSAA